MLADAPSERAHPQRLKEGLDGISEQHFVQVVRDEREAVDRSGCTLEEINFLAPNHGQGDEGRTTRPLCRCLTYTCIH